MINPSARRSQESLDEAYETYGNCQSLELSCIDLRMTERQALLRVGPTYVATSVERPRGLTQKI